MSKNNKVVGLKLIVGKEEYSERGPVTTPLDKDDKLVGRYRFFDDGMYFQAAIGLFLETDLQYVVKSTRITMTVKSDQPPYRFDTNGLQYNAFVNSLGGHSLFIQFDDNMVVYPNGHGVYLGNVGVSWKTERPDNIELIAGMHHSVGKTEAVIPLKIDWQKAHLSQAQMVMMPLYLVKSQAKKLIRKFKSTL